MQQVMKKIELLSPAKNVETGIAAIDHGADAVYIGGPVFGAREKAVNSIADIEKLCKYAALYDAKVYVTLNTLLFDNELEQARKIVCDCWNIGVDAMIIQDMALLQMDLPPIALHASTQCHNNTVEKVKFLEKMGFSQVVLARELTINEIKEISDNTDVSLEFFVHGALCVCYSGQCYMSYYIGGRSANRGACAQPCRLSWDLVDENDSLLIKNKHLLSLKDLNNSKNIRSLMDAGISSFKIEGRLKDIDYVKNTTAYYRKAIDDVLDSDSEYVRSSRGNSFFTFIPSLEKSFSRGFSDYFLNGRQKDIDSPYSPKSMGEYIGKVTNVGRNSLTVMTSKTLHNGDGLCFIDKDRQIQGFLVNGVDGKTVIPNQMRPVTKDTDIYRNSDPVRMKSLEQSKNCRKIDIKLRLFDTDNGYSMSVGFYYGDLHDITMSFPTKKIIADNKSAATDNIRRKATQWGDTPFNIKEFVLDMSETYFIPASVLGNMKRVLVDAVKSYLVSNHIENRILRNSYDNDYPYSCDHVDYLSNIINDEALKFYENHGVKDIQYGVEKRMPSSLLKVMTTKHCIRYANGMCCRETGKPATPLILKNNVGSFRIEFDCKNCVMNIFADVSK